MMFKFHKYQGAGNDFILIDSRKIAEKLFTKQRVKKLCDRNFGIGGDGLILLLESQDVDFRMKYFNSDGKEGTMCGNGGRCITAFAKHIGIISDTCIFEGIDGKHSADILKESGTVKLKMRDVEEIYPFGDGLLLDTGSTHFVKIVRQLDDLDVLKEGKAIRIQPRFGDKGTNVNFIEFSENNIRIRTYERGVENETLACGTGAVAAAISAYIQAKTDRNAYSVHARGGDLKVTFTPEKGNIFKNIWLEGPAEFVFEGTIEIQI